MATKKTSPAHTPGPWKVACDSYGKVRHSNMACVYRSEGRLTHVAHRIKNWDDARLIAAAPDLRRASQELYDRLQDYLDVSDGQLVERGHGDLVKAMDDLEAAWHKADGTTPQPDHANAA